MCFSAEASFAGAAVITAAGVGALSLVKDKREIPFAALPLLFGAHQALEGLTWVELDGMDQGRLTGFGVHSWVMFAWAFLPAYVPWAVWLLEDDPRRKRWMRWLMIVGGALAVFMAVQALQPEIGVSVVNDQLDYQMGIGFPAALLALPYVAATCLTPVLSTHRWVRAFGIANFLAMTAAAIIESKDYSSIWCTFAAFLSLMILGHYVEQRRLRNDPAPPAAQLSGA